MKMKKPSSMTTVLSRTCPFCFTMVDPVWYGWHVGKCNSYKDPTIDLIKNERHNSLPVSTCEEVPDFLPEAFAAPGSQFVDENCKEETSLEVNERELTHLRTEKQALTDKVKDLELQLENLKCQFNAEKQALADKVRCLELNVEELECHLRLSRESERKALCMVESLRGSSGKENRHVNEAGQLNQSLNITTPELKTLSSDKESTEFENDGIRPHDKQGEEVEYQNEHLENPKGKDVESVLTKSVDSHEEIELDCVVNLACTGGPLSDDFLSQVDSFIESHKVSSSTRNTSSMQYTLCKPLVNADNGGPRQDVLEKSGSQDSTKRYNGLIVMFHNGSPSTVIAEGEHHITPRNTLPMRFNLNNEGSLNNDQVEEHGIAMSNDGSVVMRNGCGPHLDAQGAAVEIEFQALDKDKHTEEVPQFLCDEKSPAKEAYSFSTSSSSEHEVCTVKTKAGLRRIVLSDSESEDGDKQPNSKEGNGHDTRTAIQTNLCNSKEFSLPFTSTTLLEEQRHDASIEFRVREACTENGVDNRVVQQSLLRRKQLKVMQSSNPCDNVLCSDVSEHSSSRSVEDPKVFARNLEGTGAEDAEPTGVRRSKRLRTLSLLKSDPGITSNQKKIRRMVVAASSSTETSGFLQGSRESNSEAAAGTHSNPVNSTLSRQKNSRRRVEVSSSSSSNTSSQDEGLPHKRSKRPPRVRKRLFEEVESKPAYGDNHPADSEDDDSEIESDSDSLKDFIVDSESEEDSLSSNDQQSLSGSHSSREAYLNPRLARDIKIRHFVWELENEMLATFAVSPELCLRAVCAINRRQTEDEQKEKMSKYVNKRGFDKLHAKRGTRIAEFLTDGDPEGPVKKSIEDLKKFDAGGLAFCKMIAAMHSKQLFEIYTNAEDPYFPFS